MRAWRSLYLQIHLYYNYVENNFECFLFNNAIQRVTGVECLPFGDQRVTLEVIGTIGSWEYKSF